MNRWRLCDRCHRCCPGRLSQASYSLDDVPGDYSLAHFDDGLQHDEALLLPLIRAALEYLEEEERVELQMTVVAKSTSSGKVSKNSDAKNLVTNVFFRRTSS